MQLIIGIIVGFALFVYIHKDQIPTEPRKPNQEDEDGSR